MIASMQTEGRVSSLHVVHIVLALDVGGLERNVVNQVREGQKLGQRVSLVCLDRPGILAPQVQALGARLVSLGREPGLRPGMVLRVRRALHDLRPHVVHTHQLATLLYGGAAAKLLGVPVVLHTEHTREDYHIRMRTRLLGRIAAQFCDRFYCLTRNMADHVLAAQVVPKCKLRIIQNGIDLGKFMESNCDRNDVRRSLRIPLDAPLIGTVGRVTEVKQQHVLIRAFAQVRHRVHNAHLVIVGDGPLMDKLRWLAASLGVGNCVHFAGAQPHSGPYLQAMDVFALTSQSEGMPQAVLEASVTGLPVVASHVGGLPEVIQHEISGILFEPGNVPSLAAILCGLIADPQRRQQLGAAARARVSSRFSVARMAREYHRDTLEMLRARRSDWRSAAKIDGVGAATMMETGR